MSVKRGDVYWVNLNPVKGSEQAGSRPVVIIQNNIGNAYGPTTIIAPLTTKVFDKQYPINVFLAKGTAGLKVNSTILLSQIRVIDQSRLGEKIGHLNQVNLNKVNQAIRISLAV